MAEKKLEQLTKQIKNVSRYLRMEQVKFLEEKL